jgi:hypothetical protein
MGRTQDEIYREGLQALRDWLGRAGMILFLRLFETGQNDYARARHTWVDRITLEELRQLSRASKPKTKRRKR